MQRFRFPFMFIAVVALAGNTSLVHATPYASNVVKTGTTVNFLLNEPSDSLKYSINGGALQSLDGTTKGAKTFNLTNASDTFSIVAEKNAAVGFTIPLPGQTIAAALGTGLSQISNASGFNLISDDASVFSRYNSPRGVDINKSPNTANFGTVYIANSGPAALAAPAAPIGPGTTPLPVARTLTGDGLYAIRSDGTDAFGNLDNAVNPTNTVDGFPAFSTASANSPFRLTVGPDGDLYVSDYSDINGQLFRVDANLSGSPTATNIFAGFGGPAPPVPPVNPDGTGLPAGQNHGSISASVVTGSLAGGNLNVWAVDEDLNSAHFGGASTNDRNSLWQWNIGGTPNSTVVPTQLAPGVVTTAAPSVPNGLIGDFPVGGITVDMARGTDGRFYLAQNRSAGTAPGILVTDVTGATIEFNSLQATKTLLADPNAVDIFTAVIGIDVSPDNKWLATMQLNNDVVLIPLVNGIPDIANRLMMDNGVNTGNGRDIAFDAAGNLHVLSSGQGMYRQLSPGGNQKTTLAWNGTTYSFTNESLAPVGVLGDYNGNGTVDAADYVLWRKGGPLQNESATPGVNDAADYDYWRSRFGATSGSGSAVPEPAAAALVALGLFAICGARKRHA